MRIAGLGAVILAAVLGGGCMTTGGPAADGPGAVAPVLQGATRLLFYGDSLTDGSDYPDYVVNTLNQQYPQAGFVLLNSAVAGDSAKDLLNRLPADVIPRQPDVVFICIGTNDCNGSRPVADYEADLRELVTQIQAAKAKVVIVLPSSFGDQPREARFAAYLEVMRRVAAANRLLVADAHALFVQGQAKGREVLGPDGVHHGKDGFATMARGILDALGLSQAPMVTTVTPWPYQLLDWETATPVPAGKPLDPTKATGWQPFDRRAAVAGQPWWDAPFAARGAWMPFALEKPNEPVIAYGRTHYQAAQAGKFELQFGGSRPLVVWLDGREVWRGGKWHGCHPDADRMMVDLAAGDHQFIVVSNYMAFLGVRPLPGK